MNCCYIFTYNISTEEYKGYYSNLLFKSIETLLMFYDKDIENIYILIDNQIDLNYYKDFQKSINKINNNRVNIIYKLIDLNITNCIKYPENNENFYKINKIGLLKFFIPYLVDCKNILYIDCDILFNQNIKDDIYKEYNQEETLIKIYQYGWNSGLILFNCDIWRKENNLLSDIIDFYNNYDSNTKADNYKLVDNNSFNWLSRLSCYCNKCIKDSNYKINFPINIPEIWYKEFNIPIDFTWENMNILHICGNFDDKIIFNDIYNYIIDNYDK